MARPTRIKAVECLSGFAVRVEMTNGKSKVIDLDRLMHGPIFEPIRNDPTLFAAVRVDPRAGTIVWPNGADIDPDVLCNDLMPCWETTDIAVQSS